ncbi:MAG: hypothetical protein IPJ41_18690 [Phycisphaerales bacterium]|nr:hypothetical protein [Phycisphaerales bacterium]
MQDEQVTGVEPVRTIEVDGAVERWPTTVGILGIVFSSLCALGFACGLAGQKLQSFALNNLPPDKQEEARAQVETRLQLTMPFPVVQYGIQLVVVLIAVLLLVGSIQILRRSRAGAKTLVLYAWLDLAMSFVGAAFGLFVVTGALAAIKQDPSLVAALGGPMFAKLMLPLVVVMFLLKCVWPAFLVIWFGRDRIRASMDRWDEGFVDDLPEGRADPGQ